jgi:hypothetical protein
VPAGGAGDGGAAAAALAGPGYAVFEGHQQLQVLKVADGAVTCALQPVSNLPACLQGLELGDVEPQLAQEVRRRAAAGGWPGRSLRLGTEEAGGEGEQSEQEEEQQEEPEEGG